ncbi:hypothetical protein PDJAM_G00012190 [Pangasius djambal]|uniref:Uncharacterized protein n=1 Tax=Pangasius djambal TaxID=1691987 RepID=A0ACC5XZZ2_9TELE|nr:hypothetical protein [Pangasius djambal]
MTEPAERAYYRFVVLFFNCMLTFGSYFCFDIPSVLQQQFQGNLTCVNSTLGNGTECVEGLGMTPQEYNLLYAIYAWTNAVVVIMAGFLIDKLGNRFGVFLFSFLCVLGSSIFALGSHFKGSPYLLPLMLTGRLLFGSGNGSLTTYYRFVVLFFNCMLTFGSYFCFDIPSVLQQQFQGNLTCVNSTLGNGTECVEGLGMTPQEYNLLYAIYAWTNAVVVIMAGFLIDKLGNRCSSIFALGSHFKGSPYLLPLMLTGRLLFGSGNGSLTMWTVIVVSQLEKHHLCIDTMWPKRYSFPSLELRGPNLLQHDDAPVHKASSMKTCKFIQDKYEGYSQKQAAYIAGAVYDSSLVLSAAVGILIDYVGLRGVFAVLCAVCTLPVFGLLAFTFVPPLISTIWLGITYSFAAASMWPSIPLVVPRSTLGTAMGLATSVQMIGIGLCNLIVGEILGEKNSDVKIPLWRWQRMMIFMLANTIGCIIMSTVLNIIDRREGGTLNKMTKRSVVQDSEVQTDREALITSEEEAGERDNSSINN